MKSSNPLYQFSLCARKYGLPFPYLQNSGIRLPSVKKTKSRKVRLIRYSRSVCFSLLYWIYLCSLSLISAFRQHCLHPSLHPHRLLLPPVSSPPDGIYGKTRYQGCVCVYVLWGSTWGSPLFCFFCVFFASSISWQAFVHPSIWLVMMDWEEEGVEVLACCHMRESAYIQCLWIRTGKYRHRKKNRIVF